MLCSIEARRGHVAAIKTYCRASETMTDGLHGEAARTITGLDLNMSRCVQQRHH